MNHDEFINWIKGLLDQNGDGKITYLDLSIIIARIGFIMMENHKKEKQSYEAAQKKVDAIANGTEEQHEEA